MTISMAGLPAFLLYFVVGAALIAAFTAIYLRMTAHDEIALIRGGNISAAVAMGGNIVGFSLPLEQAISQASSIADCVLWALVAMIIQFIAYALARLLIPELSRKIEQDSLPSALMLAVIAIYCVVNVVLQVLVQPKFVSDAVNLSLTLSFLSVVFWTFVIGPLGAILSIPLTLLVRALVLGDDPGTRWLRWLSGDAVGPAAAKT